MKAKWFFLGPLALVAIAALVALGGEIVKLLWNWLLPPLFGWKTIGFWQALGLLVLCRILFGRLGGRGPRGPRVDLRLTPDERDRMRRRWRERWGLGGESERDPGAGTSL
jgi:hypothetical protein